MTTPLQTHILPSSQHTSLLSPYTLLYLNPHINTIYASTPIPNYIPKHILLFTITPLPPLLTFIYSILHSITYSLITTSILLSLTLLTLIAFIITYVKHKHLSLFITNSKVKFVLYLITHITFSISAVMLRNIIKQTVNDKLFAVRIDFVFVDVDIAYGVMWLMCNYVDYMWYMVINVIVLVVKVPLICVDEYFEVVTTCTVVGWVCGVVGLSYGMTRLHKEVFGIRRIGSVVEDVVNMMGMGMISVDVDVDVRDNKKEGKRDVKWNKYVEGNEVLRGMIGEHGEGVEKVFKGMKEVNREIGWEVDKDNNDKSNVNDNDDNNDGNELSKRSGSVTNKSSINKIMMSNHNNNYSHSHSPSHSPSYASSSKVFNIDINSKHNTSHNKLNANNNNNSSSLNCMNTNSLQHTILNHLNIPNHQQHHHCTSLSSSSSFHTFLSTLTSFSFSSPSPLIYLGTQTFTTPSHSTLLQSPSSFLFLKIFYTYNPILNRITFIFLDESKTNYDDLFKTYIQQISMYLHDFKNPLVTIEEKINQFKDIIDYLPFHTTNTNINTTSISTTNIDLLEKQLLNNINFISITASDCVCMVRSYEDFAKGVVSNNQESKLELRSFPLNEIYDYLQEWVTMKIERSGYDVKFIVDLDETVPSKFILCTDKMKLKQILMNILSNAIKFTFEGSITLHIERKEVNDVWYTKFEVEDTGTGMDEDVKRNLFKPFVSNNKCKNNKHGCGLGMLISLHNSERLGKGIEVESCEGKGTKMWFYVEEKEISQSHLSSYIDVNDVHNHNQQGVKLNRRLFQHSARCINALKGKKFNTQCHYHTNNNKQSNSMIINYNNKQYNMLHKSKTLPSTLGSTDDVGVNNNNVHYGKTSIKDNNNININEEEHKSIHHTNIYNETELYKDPIQILPTHKTIMQSNTSLNSGDTNLNNANAHPNNKKKSKSEMYWLDKSKTVSKDIVDMNMSIPNDNNYSQYNSPDITPCLLNINNMPYRKVVDSPILSYYKNPLISPSLNAISVFRPPNYNLLNYNNNSFSKSKPTFSQIYNAHATSASCMAIKKYLKKDCFHSCSTFGEVNNQMLMNFSVLLCDDDESILSAHIRILNERGVHKVDTIYDGLDLVKMFINGNVNDYDLILLDYSMKCMDGTDAVRIIRFMKENGIGGRCGFNYEVLNKIIFASGALDVVRDIMNDKEGMFKYYNKPINKRDLKKILKDCSVIK